MSELPKPLPGHELPPELPGESAAHQRWLQDLGRDVESFAYMLRKPTDRRPFVYEVRFDLIPAKRDDPVLVLKGFGQDGAVVAFHSASGLLMMLRGCQGQMSSGKLKWYPDTYPPGGYEEKVRKYLSGEFYR